METWFRDVRYAVRMMWREPGVSLLAALALALGIGATTAIFTVVDSVLLRPMAYKDPERLVVALGGPTASAPVSPADYFDYRRDARSFERLSAAQAWGATLSGLERPERLSGLQVSSDLFQTLGVPPYLGRTFVDGDDQPGRERIAVLSHALWQRRFGGDRSIIGRTIVLDGRDYVVVGVMPAGFRFAPFWQTRAELWTPLSLAARLDDRGGRSLRLFARLRDGVSVAQAQAELNGIASRLERDYPQTNTGVGITVRPLLDKVVAGIRPTLVALMGMVTFVLLIACANVANTLLARASGRQREIALRVAIGAGRTDVLRQMLTESLLLAIAGAGGGLLLAYWGVDWLLAMLPPGSMPRQQDVGLDTRVLLVTAGATILAGLGTGCVPALQAMRNSVASAFQDGGKGTTESGGRKRTRSLVVAGEVALALVLLVGAGLMARTMLKLTAIDPGFRIDHLAVATVSLSGTPHAQPDARLPMYVRVTERLKSIPGVTSVSAINHLPLAGDLWNLGYAVEGRPQPAPGQRPSAAYRIIQPGYFATMGIPLLGGREFSEADNASSIPVAVINKAMADREWPGESPLGRRIQLPGVSDVQTPITIVGVAANARQSDWTSAPESEVYLPFPQRASEFGLAAMTFVIRTNIDADTVASAIPREIALLDRSVPVSDNTTMEAVVGDELWRERLTAQLTAGFALVALGLSAVGVYAVVAYAVVRRTREFGVRVALGATSANILGLALGEAMRPVVAGSLAGIVATILCARAVQTLLYGVTALDPLVLTAAVGAMLAIAAAAALVPARWAIRQDPVAALRRE
jgi:predicted permease